MFRLSVQLDESRALQQHTMDSKRYDHGTRSNSDSPPVPPSPPLFGSNVSTHDLAKSRSTCRRSQSPDHRPSRSSRIDSPERRRRKRSSSRSSPVRTYRRSRSNDRERDRDRERLRKYSRRERSKSRSRGRSRSKGRSRSRGGSRSRGNISRGRSRSRDRRRSRSRNKSRERQRFREIRKHRTSSYESDAPEEALEVAPPPPVILPQPNAFKNDGSFMEMFKKMQEQMQPVQKPTTSILEEKPVAPPPLMVGKRRGGRILKTGMVAKPKVEQTVEQPKDAWSLYMAEVKKYREVCCQEEDNTRPLVK